jgi:hypothetical protein
MGGMRVANTKLRGRAVQVCVETTGCGEEAARAALTDAGWELDAALVIIAAARRPRRVARAPVSVGRRVPPGAPADVVVLDDRLEIRRVLVGGGVHVAAA